MAGESNKPNTTGLSEDWAAMLEAEATTDGFPLKQLFLRVVSASLTKGRAPLMGDFDADARPYVAEYSAESAINWREDAQSGRRDLTLVVFEEERLREHADEFSVETDKVYRVLDTTEGRARVRLLDESGAPIADDEMLGRENGASIEALSYLPVVFVGSTDNNADVDEIPLLTMAQKALEYYQLSADLRASLHYASHPQPVVTGLPDDQDLRVTGPQAAWVLPEGGDAKYMEATAQLSARTRNAAYHLMLAWHANERPTPEAMQALKQELCKMKWNDSADAKAQADAVIEKHTSEPAGVSELAPHRAQIDTCFGHDRIEDIIAALQADGSDWANETLQALYAMSPTSLKIALRQIRMGANMPFAQVMTMEYRLSQALMNRHDFYEGIRAALIDKDRQPKWQPPRITEVSDLDVDACFQSLGERDLVL